MEARQGHRARRGRNAPRATRPRRNDGYYGGYDVAIMREILEDVATTLAAAAEHLLQDEKTS